MIRRQKLEHLATTRVIEGKHSRGKQQEKILDGVTKWLNLGRVTDEIMATRGKHVWKVMITCVKEHSLVLVPTTIIGIRLPMYWELKILIL